MADGNHKPSPKPKPTNGRPHVAAEALVEMKVADLSLDPLTNMPILILRALDGPETVPIWIGLMEASAIASQLEKVQMQRPMSHDLMKSLLGSLGGRVAHVEIQDVRENTFYAAVFVHYNGQLQAVDARPSDAVALALRCDAPIRVARHVIRKAKSSGNVERSETEACGGDDTSTDRGHYRELLESLADEDFGKWKM